MGVDGLWDLLAPIGRRVSVETLAGKKLAIDASIWMVQFMKAMRDENGEMVKNAHLLGFFRRICKLLFLRTKPVFVFDGGTPALKRRTVIARRRQRENAQTKIRKTAEKLLLNHLKAMKLKEVANDLDNQKRNLDTKGKKIVLDEIGMEMDNPESRDMGLKSHNQEKLDEMLATSLAAEEDGDFGAASTSGGGIPNYEDDDDDEDEDDDEEMIVPAMHGNIDPAVLASLPLSMQLDLLGEMRERLMADNRQRYQKVKKAPAKFSELQIQTYLKTVAFRREIDEVQKSAAGRRVNGAQVSRIASEANREFIFSSSFTGDKQALTSAGVVKNGDNQNQTGTKHPSSNSKKSVGSTVKSNYLTESGLVMDEPQRPVDDVQTYIDVGGRRRVSRRAMGIRMTRDLQRNLELMKEIEQEKIRANTTMNAAAPSCEEENENRPVDNLVEDDNHGQQPMSKNGISIEISFEKDAQDKCADDEDDVFACLVANSPEKLASNSASDCDWEEGAVGDFIVVPKSSLGGVNSVDESDVEWEEGVCDASENPSSFQDDCRMAISRGDFEEEADLQEAIKISLEDSNNKNSVDRLTENVQLASPLLDALHPTGSLCAVDEVEKDKKTGFSDEIYDGSSHSDSKHSEQVAIINENLIQEVSCRESAAPVEQKDLGSTLEQSSDALHNGDQVSNYSQTCLAASSASSNLVLANGSGDLVSATPQCHPNEVVGVSFSREESNLKPGTADVDLEVKTVEEISDDQCTEGRENNSLFKPADEENGNVQIDVAEANLEEELLILDQEHRNLGDEKRKLERNAESVSSEMFAECQELLQMFGLPYIIAPMEAEAQCAFMELTNLVDGVVTDDSDVFLFGGQSVHKNIFDDRKYVETYFMKDIENELGLSRDKIIRMAMLLGSDYTEGISGVGIVNAIEILNAFPEEDGLLKFQKWIESPDPTILEKVDVKKNSRKRGSNSKTGASLVDGNVSESNDDTQNVKQTFMDRHRNISKNWHVPSSFPNEAVMSAYLCPQVDKSTEPFTWGKPDLSVLRKLCWEKFGWGSQKSDDLLLPVLKEYSKHETQLRLEAFYTFNERFAKIRSRRMHTAVRGITQKLTPDLVDDEDASLDRRGRKKKRGAATKSGDKSNKFLDGAEAVLGQGNDKPLGKKTATKTGKRSLQGDFLASELENLESSAMEEGPGRASRSESARGGRRKGKKQRNLDSDVTKNSSGEQDPHIQCSIKPGEVRRSKRPRKLVKYDSGIDDAEEKPMDQSRSCGKSTEESLGHDNGKFSNEHGLSGFQGKSQNEDARVSSSEKVYRSPETDATDVCLKSGGGFCAADDDELRDKPNKFGLCPRKDDVICTGEDESRGGSSSNGLMVEEQDGRRIGEDAEAVAESNSFRAMPLLRRKRKN